MNKPFAGRLGQLIGPRGCAIAGFKRVVSIPNRRKDMTVQEKGETTFLLDRRRCNPRADRVRET